MEKIVERDGVVEIYPGFFNSVEASTLLSKLLRTLDWREEKIRMFGQMVPVPRLVCWYGDQHAHYTYSGVGHKPLPWTVQLQKIKKRIESETRQTFNSVLGNLYRNEKDSMGWHSDNEKELGKNPVIASLSIGEQRDFHMRHKKSRCTVKLPLDSGSLLVMSGEFQHHWQHCLPKCRVAKQPRINLTFRYIN